MLVAVKDNEVLGYSCFKYENEKYDSELISLYIKPGNTGKGIGTRLFKETTKLLYENNKKNMIVWCFKDNKKACKFYEDLGGVVVEEKIVTIGNEQYEEVGYYYDTEAMNIHPF